ncbi:uncharacterized protein LOC143228040 [Tachypleus tridentatus]|uniref:uncharacterized protein LOC143228040 n=1 Tax=Tachypleus tridentatus TaxID=6853 RepID=UPI003FD27469
MYVVVSKATSPDFYFCLVIFGLLATSGNGISCYTCSSRNKSDLSCHEPFVPANSTYTENCMVPTEGRIRLSPARFCLKVLGKTAMNNEEVVIRACVREPMENHCGVFKYGEDTFKGCIVTCDYDGCNGLTQTVPNSSTSKIPFTAIC